MTDSERCASPIERRKCAAEVTRTSAGLIDLAGDVKELKDKIDSLDSKYVRIERYRLIEIAVIGAIALLSSRGYLNDVEPKTVAAPPPPIISPPPAVTP